MGRRFSAFLVPLSCFRSLTSPPKKREVAEASGVPPPYGCYWVVITRKERGFFTVETTELVAFFRMFGAGFRSEWSL